MANHNPTDVEEIWKTIPDFSNYEASNLGHIRRTINQRVLKPTAHRRGKRPRVTVWKHGQPVSHFVARLVAMAFHGPCPDGYECNHIDGVRTNNHADNLEWVTRQANRAHAIAFGLIAKGSRQRHAKLTEEQVREIKKELAKGATSASLGRRYGVRYTTISAIKNGRAWKHV